MATGTARTAKAKEDRELGKLQLAATPQDTLSDDAKQVEEKQDGLYAPLRDEKFRLSEEVATMALMEWAASGDDEEAGAGLRAVYHVLQSIVHDDDWLRFKAYSLKERIQFNELRDFQNAAFEVLAANPTKPSGN